MKVDLFDFHLPEENIALRPVSPREAARLLHITPPDGLADYHVGDLPDLLQPGDALVFNDTKVIPARLNGRRFRYSAHAAGDGQTVANVNVTLHMRMDASCWKAFIKPARRLIVGEEIIFSSQKTGENPPLLSAQTALITQQAEVLKAHIIEKGEAGEMLLRFNKSGGDLDRAIADFGVMPLPPYIAARRAEDAQDKSDYQTIYAREEGAVAAPTAGLHFTPALLQALHHRGIKQYFVTLHVGAGTFLPVKVEDTKSHKMHAEFGTITAETAAGLQAVKARGGKIIAVGTTALRLLESATNENGQLRSWQGATDIFITPGYRFRFVDSLLTNFHLPRSTLFMLVSAFSGLELMQKAYAHAVKKNYRFYSYGDTSLLELARNT